MERGCAWRSGATSALALWLLAGIGLSFSCSSKAYAQRSPTSQIIVTNGTDLPTPSEELATIGEIEDQRKRAAALRAFIKTNPKSDQLMYATWGLVDSLLKSNARTAEIIAACDQAAASVRPAFERHSALREMRAELYSRAASLLAKRNAQRDMVIRYIATALDLLIGADGAYAQRIRTEVGSAYLTLGNATAAADLLREVVTADPDQEGAWNFLGRAYEALRKPDAAIDAYLRAATVYGKESKEATERLRRAFEARHGSVDGLDGLMATGRSQSLRREALTARRYVAPAPDWHLEDLAGKTMRSVDYSGRVVVLTFWGSWCRYCERDLSQLDSVYRRFNGRAAVVGINVERPSSPTARKRAAKEFLSEHLVTFPIVVDLDDAVPAFYGIEAFPTVFVLDRTGTIQYRNVGEAEQLETILDLQISSILESTDKLPPVNPIDQSREPARLAGLATQMHDVGQYRGMAQVADRALALADSRDDSKDLVPRALRVAAHAREHLRDYVAAQALLTRYVRELEARPETDTLMLGDAFNSLAKSYLSTGNIAAAEPVIARAIVLHEGAGAQGLKPLATMLLGFGNLFIQLRDFGRAREVLVRANAILAAENPGEPAAVAESLVNLGNLYHSWGDDKRAIDYLERATAPAKQAGAAGVSVSVTLFSLLAHIYVESPQSREAEYLKAEQLFDRIRGVYESAYAADSQPFGALYLSMASLAMARDDLDAAEALLKRAQRILEAASNDDESQLLPLITNLGYIDYARGRYDEAEKKYFRQKAIAENAYGPHQYYVETAWRNLGFVYQASGRGERAVAAFDAANEMAERRTAVVVASGSEDLKRSFMAGSAFDADYTVTLHVRSVPTSVAASRLALTAILRHKGRVLDVMADMVSSIRTRAGTAITESDRMLLDQWAASRSQLAALALRQGDEPSAAELEQRREEVERVETKLSALRQRVGLPDIPVTIDAVQKVIPPDSRLVEFFLYHPYDREQRRLGPGHYVVYILSPTGEPTWIELTAPADEVDLAVTRFRDVLRDPATRIVDVKTQARAVYDLVMRPVAERLGIPRGRLLISPDGQLNLLPFAALVDETGQFLIERFSFTYLTSGRDLLRLQNMVTGGNGNVVVANPDFRPITTDPVAALGPGSTGLQPQWAALQGTEAAIQALLPSAQVLWGPQATEAAVKRLNSPAILHFVTHGLFLPAPPLRLQHNPGPVRDVESLFSGLPQEASAGEPMLRSGLVLAAPASDQDDGILRALEVAGLNLFGTKLVVLSACDTGRGDVRDGEGVYGLRRALVMAGAETLIVSLWKVDEIVANRLFKMYYLALGEGQGRADGLRAVQLEALSDPTLRHPYFWAAFIQGGAWSPLDDATATSLRAGPR